MSIAVAALQAWNGVATLLVVRAAPVLIFLLVTSQTSLRRKLGVLALGGVFAVLTQGWALIPWTWFGLSYLYLIGLGCLVPIVARRMQTGRLSRIGAFTLCLCGFLVVPGLFWPPAMKLVALVIAWDIVLSSYSYCVEIARSGAPPSRADCLFFLLVNPSLVYTQRGTRTGAPSFERAGFERMVLAVFTFFSTSLLLIPLLQLILQKAAASGAFTTAHLLLCGSLAFGVQYAQASALASLQIGLLRQTGYRIPERYDWPIRAKTLPEFWRRWNTYVSQWTLHYLFWPLSLELGRRCRARRARMLITVAVLLPAFTVVGFLHDCYASLLALTMHSRLTMLFTVNGMLVVVWMALERFGQSVQERNHLPRWLAPLTMVISRACLWCFVSLCAAYWFRL